MSQGFLSEVRRLEHSATDKTDVPRDETDAVAEPQDTQEANLPDPVSSSQRTESQMTEEFATSASSNSPQEDATQPSSVEESIMSDTNESVQSAQSSPHEQENSVQDESVQKESIQDESAPDDGLENVPPGSDDNPIQVTESQVAESQVTESQVTESTISVEQYPLEEAQLEEAQLEEARTVNVEVVESESYLSDVNMKSSREEEPIFSVLDAHVVTSSDVADSDDDGLDEAAPSANALSATPDMSEQLEEAIAQLDASKQREAKLSTRIQEIEAQLSQQTQTVEKLRLDVEVIQTSKKEILADLAEAKRYVLQLTDLKQSSSSQDDMKGTELSSAIAPSSKSSVDSVHRSNGPSSQPIPSSTPG
ncbi:MAG: hypothetical protein VKL39_08450, partial [Leptolyngbyaceae bacterium]|nr:hypothetical protein [Leptolyngbyaceae bacterium]